MATNKVLGIAMGDNGCTIAEVAIDNGAVSLLKSVHLPFPAGVSLQNPAEAGKLLAASLKTNGVTAKRTIMGLPSKWLVTRRKQLPPMKAEVAASTLRLGAEAEFSSELKDLVIDYAGETSPSAPSTVLVVGASRERLDQCVAIARAAGLSLHGMTSTGIALADVEGEAKGDAVVLSIGPENGELVIRQKGLPPQIRHLAIGGPDQLKGAVVAELRRACAGLAAEGGKAAVTLWADKSAGVPHEIQDKLGISLTPGSLPLTNGHEVHAPAAAIAVAGARPGGINFLSSRLAPPAAQSNRKPLVWAAAAAGVLLVAAAGAAFDLHRQQSALAQLKAHLTTVAPEVKKAEVAAGRLATARGWMASKPRYVACLSELTNLFPDEGSIYANTVSLRADLSGQVMGKASSEQQVLGLLDRLKDSKRFGDLKLLDMRDAGRNSREVAFSISFLYKPEL